MILDELKEVDILILRKMFSISKENNDCSPSPVQGKILMYLYNHKEDTVYQRDLENVVSCSKVSLSEMLNKLETNKEIKRIASKSDKRTKRIVLTEKGLKKIEDFNDCVKHLESELLKDFSDDEKKQLFKLIDKMKNNLKEDINA